MMDQTSGSPVDTGSARSAGAQAAGLIPARPLSCPHCGATHSQGPFCPESGLALPRASDARCGQTLAGHILVDKPLWASGRDAFYLGRQGTEVLLVKFYGVLARQSADPEARRRLVEERRIHEELSDLPFVPRWLQADEAAVEPYAVLQVPPGKNLAHLLEERLPLAEAVSVGLQLLSDVKILHGRGVTLGSPGITALFVADESHTVLLVDLGQARTWKDKAHVTATLQPGDISRNPEETAPRSPRDGSQEVLKRERQRDVAACRHILLQLLEQAAVPDALTGPVAEVCGLCHRQEATLSLLRQSLEELRFELERAEAIRNRPLTGRKAPLPGEETEAVAPARTGRRWVWLAGAMALACLAALWWIHHSQGRRASPAPERSAPGARPRTVRLAPRPSHAPDERYRPVRPRPPAIRAAHGKAGKGDPDTRTRARNRDHKDLTRARDGRPVRFRPAAPRPTEPSEADFQREADEAIEDL